MSKKTPFDLRTAEFAETGAKLAAKCGLDNLTRRAIAQEHGVTDPLVGKHLGKREEMRATIKKTMKRLGLSEPAKDAVVKPTKKAAAKPATKKAAAKPAAKKAAAKKAAAKPAKKAPANKAVKKAPANKPNVFVPKLPPVPVPAPAA